MDVHKLTPIADYFIIATGEVDVHVQAIADNILSTLKDEKIKPLHVEGLENQRWVLIDFVDVVVHIFLPEARDFYGIERLWAEAETKRYEE